MDVANKFELHYYLRDESHQVNAFLRNKCEAEILAIIYEISLTLGFEPELVSTASKEGGYREFWDIVQGNASAITVVLLVSQIMLQVVPMIHESEKEELEKELNRLQIEEAKLNIEKLKKEIKNAEVSPDTIEKTTKSLSGNLKIIKRKSNFYAALNSKFEIKKVGFSVLDSNFTPKNKELQVERRDFRKYILKSNKLRPKEVEAEIEIISPVLIEGKYRWKGIYNKQSIGFEMLDYAFKESVLLDKITFQNGSSIVCVLKIFRELDEVGEIKVTGYAVTTVIEKVDDLKPIETRQGKRYRQFKKDSESQGDMFDNF